MSGRRESSSGNFSASARRFAALAILVPAAVPLGAEAQTAPATQDQQPVVTAQSAEAPLQTVTVTARYQVENLQKTPIAITAVTSQELVSSNIKTVDTLGQLVPNLYTAPPDADEGGVPTI